MTYQKKQHCAKCGANKGYLINKADILLAALLWEALNPDCKLEKDRKYRANHRAEINARQNKRNLEKRNAKT